MDKPPEREYTIEAFCSGREKSLPQGAEAGAYRQRPVPGFSSEGRLLLRFPGG